MSTAANAAFFARPHWLVIARGFDTERWFSDGQAIGTGGIVNPQPTRLPSGQYYYRFASSSSVRTAQLAGGWWLDFENFALIRRFAADHGYPLREAARLMLALPYAWTRVDLLVRALLREPLRAYTGLGKPAQAAVKAALPGKLPAPDADRGTRWIPTQHVAVRQLYVPALFEMVDGRPLHETVFSQPVEVSRLP
jgi:hypothetical protein